MTGFRFLTSALTSAADRGGAWLRIATSGPMGLGSFTDDRHPVHYGEAVVVLRSLPGQPGTATLKVTASDMQATSRMNMKSP